MKPKGIWDYIVNCCLSIILVFSLSFAVITSIENNYSAMALLKVVVIIHLILGALFFNKLISKISLIAIPSFIVGMFALLTYTKRVAELYVYVQNYFYWIYNYVNGYDEINRKWLSYTVILLAIGFSIPTFIMTAKRFRFMPLLIIGSTVFVAQWCFNIFVSNKAFYFFAFIILVYYLKHIYYKNLKKGMGSFIHPAAYTLLIIPICSIVLLISYTLPEKSKPLEWPWLDKKVISVSNQISARIKYGGSEYFNLKSTGFNDSSSYLGGKINLDNTLVMEVDAPRRAYLKGVVKDQYTGSSWVNSKNFASERVKDPNEKIQIAMSNTGTALMFLLAETGNEFNSMAQDMFFNDEISIKYKNMNTKTIFLPASTYEFVNKSKSKINYSYDDNRALTSESMLQKGFWYSLKVASFNPESDNFKKALRFSRIGFIKDTLEHYRNNVIEDPNLNEPVAHIGMGDGSNINIPIRQLKLVAEEVEKVNSQYLQLPQKLPLRVFELAHAVTEKQGTNYDKVKAVEHFLSTNYKYTLTPGKTPRDKDFADYFLFNLKEGYCTYYATAMTVMVRSLGIPARYVEGYSMPSSKKGNVWEVTNKQAHAWCEVYFEGLGWINFEPTAPYNSSLYSKQEQRSAAASFNSPGIDEYMKRMRPDMPVPSTQPLKPDTSNTPDVSATKKKIPILLMAIIVLIVLTVITIAVNIIRSYLRVLSFKKGDPKRGIIKAFGYYMRVLALQKYRIKPGETPSEFALRVDKGFYNLRFGELTNKFISARYSKAEIAEGTRGAFIAFHKELHEHSRNNMGTMKYLVLKHFAGVL